MSLKRSAATLAVGLALMASAPSAAFAQTVEVPSPNLFGLISDLLGMDENDGEEGDQQDPEPDPDD